MQRFRSARYRTIDMKSSPRDRLEGRLLRTVALLVAVPVAVPAAFAGCDRGADAPSAAWAGTIDTLPSGRVVVTNTARPTWGDGEGWTVTEDLRIGSLDELGPTQFGQILGLDVDDYGRIWVLESQANEIRVFGADGAHVRTIGRDGGGPGEFAGPAHAEFGPDGNFWVPDPRNNRVSVIDTTGTFVTSHRMEGGFFISPWPGGFDMDGRYYLPIPHAYGDGEFGIAIVRYTTELAALDTIPQLRNPNPPRRFELVSPDGDGSLIATVPFSAGLTTYRSPQGTMWGLMTGDYRMFEVSAAGDTVRTIQARYDPLPVTAADRGAAIEGLSWFVDQGGRVDPSLLPDSKPAAWSLFVDEMGRIWVDRITDDPGGRDFDVFDAEGRFLGPISLPARLPFQNTRRVVGDRIYGVTQDDLGVSYVVRMRIEESSVVVR